MVLSRRWNENKETSVFINFLLMAIKNILFANVSKTTWREHFTSLLIEHWWHRSSINLLFILIILAFSCVEYTKISAAYFCSEYTREQKLKRERDSGILKENIIRHVPVMVKLFWLQNLAGYVPPEHGAGTVIPIRGEREGKSQKIPMINNS